MTHNNDEHNLDHNDDLKERMETVALLAGHDPERIKVVDEIAALGGEEGPAGREWLALLEETERLKLALVTVPVPAGLEQRLLAVVDEPVSAALPWFKRPLGELITWRVVSAAAAVLILAAGVWLAVVQFQSHRETQELNRLASVAAGMHTTWREHLPAGGLDTADPHAAEAWLKSRIPFQPYILNGNGITLAAANVVHYDKAPAALTTWQKDGHSYSLLEFDPASENLAADFAKRECQSAGFKIVLWSEPNRGCGWALVMDNSAPNTFTY